MMKRFRTTIIVILIYLTAFIITVIAYGLAVNGGKLSGHLQDSPSTLPLLYVRAGGKEINEMHGYLSDISASYFRDTMTPVGESRTINFSLRENEYSIITADYQLYDDQYKTLLEEGSCSEIERVESVKQMTLGFRNAMESNREYILRVILHDVKGTDISYYTRIRYGSDLKISEKIQFVTEFNEATFDPDNADRLENYLETKSSAASNDFSDVTIFSSSSLVTWGSLDPQRVSELSIKLKEINTETAAFTISYRIQSKADGLRTTYTVTEYYRMRWTKERVYLLYFERWMDEELSLSQISAKDGSLRIGIGNPADGDTGVYGTSDHSYAYASIGGHLWMYDCDARTMSEVYTDDESRHGCTQNPDQGIKVIKGDDETGDLYFVVYGYMHQGEYEGREGALFYHYNAKNVSLEQLMFIPSEKGYNELKKGLTQLAYMNSKGEIYFMLGDTVYRLDAGLGYFEIIVTDLSDSVYAVSDEGMLAVAVGDNEYAGEKIHVINFNTDKEKDITADGELMIPLGFDGANLVFGYIDEKLIAVNSSGLIQTPMNRISIVDAQLNEIKAYQKNGYYIMSVTFSGNNMILNLGIAGGAAGSKDYEITGQDYIIRNQLTDDHEIRVETAKDSIRGLQYVVNLTDTSNFVPITQRARLIDPGYDIEKEEVKQEDEKQSFIVYTRGRLEATFSSCSEAVAYCNEHETFGGSVFTSKNQLLWQRAGAANIWDLGLRSVKTSGNGVTPYQAILDTICSYEGFEAVTIVDQKKGLYEQMQLLPCEIIDLTGMNLSDVIHFVYRDRLVVAKTGDKEYGFIVGYDPNYVQVASVETGEVSWYSWSMARSIFNEAGNVFISYAE